jgi:hypothetical protein
MEMRDRLPDHAVPDEIRRRPISSTIRIGGLVARPVTLGSTALAALAQVSIEEPFSCEEGWTVPNLRWQGIKLADVLALAKPLEPAQFVRVCSGSYAISVRLSEASSILLCDTWTACPCPSSTAVPGGSSCLTASASQASNGSTGSRSQPSASPARARWWRARVSRGRVEP